jgi:hypothetical protein
MMAVVVAIQVGNLQIGLEDGCLERDGAVSPFG